MWNTTFSDCGSELEHTSQLARALLKLRSIADIRLPCFLESLEAERSAEHRQLPSFVDTQKESENVISSTNPGSSMNRSTSPLNSMSSRTRKTTPKVVIYEAQPLHKKRAREETPESGPRKSKKRASTPKLRHDDSQIQFVAIESSPIVDTVLDSQLLTDRQKEVKERQRAEAAMFPDIRSGPLPIDRILNRRSTSVELPFHRPSSQSHLAISPDRERQTTPTLVPQVEDDDYVNSSPTPTRALSVQCNELDPPSSPPEARPMRNVLDMEEPVIPSSPPEAARDLDYESTASVEPSAQIDPFAVGINVNISALELTPDEQDQSMIADSFARHQPVPTKSAISNPTSAPEPVEVRETPNTPTHSRDNASLQQQTPKTPVFHDALRSPASSSKFTNNDEVFQDALSSPGLILDNSDARVSPSSSDLDESSILRLMIGFDQGSGRPLRNDKSSFEDSHEAASEPSFPSEAPSQSLSLAETHFTTSADELHAKSAMGTSDSIGAFEDISERGTAQGLCSMLSLIPETPGTTQMIVVDGVEYDPDDTIVVDLPDDFEAYPKPSKKKISPRKKGSLGLANSAKTSASKKRKRDDGYSKEVSESPGADTESKSIPQYMLVID